MSELVKGYYILSETAYGDSYLKTTKYSEEILIGFYYSAPDGGYGCKADMAEVPVHWYNLFGDFTPCLEVFPDGFNTLKDPFFTELMTMTHNFTPEEVITLLKKYGYKDLTDRG